MLILIAGVTGNMGRALLAAALAQGHTVRGLGRTPATVPPTILSSLESFVSAPDTPSIPPAVADAAVAGVDAIIDAYPGTPRFALDAQLALLRAAERAGVKRFHAASWNMDWRDARMGEIESYDACLAFRNIVRSTSCVRPCWVFTGVLAKTLFGVPGAGALEGDAAWWVRLSDGEGDKRRRINAVGDGNTTLDFSTEEDAAAFSVRVITAPGAEDGGDFFFRSDAFTLRELAAKYEAVRGPGASAVVVSAVSAEVLEAALAARREATRGDQEAFQKELMGLVGMAYGVHFAKGLMRVQGPDLERFPGVKQTSVEEYIRQNEWV